MATFYDNLRSVPGLGGENPFHKLDPISERRWKNADMEGLSRWAEQESSKTNEQRLEEIEQRGRASGRGTVFLERDALNDPNMFEIDPQIDFFSNLQIAQNSGKLNKIIDDYESAKSWDERQQIIKKGYDSFPNKTSKLVQWFDNFATLTSKAANPKDDFNDAPEEIAGTMRYYLGSARDKYFKKM